MFLSLLSGFQSTAVIDQVFAGLDFGIELASAYIILQLIFLFAFFTLLLAFFIITLFGKTILLTLLPLNEVNILLLLNMLVQVLVVFIPEGVLAVAQLLDFVIDGVLPLSLFVVKGLLFLVNVLSILLIFLFSCESLFL